MNKLISALMLCALLLPACVVKTKGNVPPGQVQKGTGYNPSSGKVKK